MRRRQCLLLVHRADHRSPSAFLSASQRRPLRRVPWRPLPCGGRRAREPFMFAVDSTAGEH